MTLLNMLHHPIYAGAYRWGHREIDPRKKVPGRPTTGRTLNSHDACRVLIRDRFAAYIPWGQFENNQQKLEDNSSLGKMLAAPRHGPSVLAGLVVCGRYGCRMPWLIMTSPTNDAETRRFFEEHDYFGLGAETVHLFIQGTNPILDREGRLLLAEEDRLLVGPDGHGGVFRALAEADIEGALVSIEPPIGPMDMLAALVGPERLAMDMMDEPEAVAEKARDCVRLWHQVYEAQWDVLGRPDGVVGFGVYIPGRSALWSEDAMALVGPRQFR